MHTTFQQWTEQQRLERGLFNGERVQMARESRGIARYELARKLKLATKILAEREQGWHFWDDTERMGLAYFTDYPPAFFAQDDPPAFTAPIFSHETDAEGNTWCHVDTSGERA
jgi:transcriptional regulator with XRE-family HTH domain